MYEKYMKKCDIILIGSDDMPSTLTHSQFIMDVYEQLDSETRHFLIYNQEHLKTFSQGMDPLYFYKFFTFGGGEKVHSFSKYFHSHKSGKYLTTLTNYIKYNYYGNNPEIISFLYGMISHYVLDSTLHPLIIYKTGFFDKDDLTTAKYNGKHHEAEVSLDNYIIKTRYKNNPYKYKIYKECFNIKRFSSDLKHVIDFSFQEVYNAKNMSSIYEKSIKDMHFIYKYGRYDPLGIKIKIYGFLNLFKSKRTVNLKVVSFHQRINTSYFNLEKKTWNNPTMKSMKSKYSIIELYIIALHKAVKIINEVNKYIYHNKKVNLNKLYGNLSYGTGIDCTKNKPFKYFEI